MNGIYEFFIYRSCVLKSQIKSQFGIKINVQKCEPLNIPLSKFTVFSNPNDGNFILSFEAEISGKGNIIIMNIAGVEIVRQDYYVFSGLNELTFSMNNIPEGLYFVIIQTEHRNYPNKLLVVR